MSNTENTKIDGLENAEGKVIIDAMIDIETLGTDENSVVLSMAVVLFDRAAIQTNPALSILNGEQERSANFYPKHFHTPVSLLECLAAGCEISKGTAVFWKRQKDKSQLVTAMAYEEPLNTTLGRLRDFLAENSHKCTWAKSPTFDHKILRALSKAVNVDLGIDFRRERDVRTEIDDYPQFDVRKISEKLKVVDEAGNVLGLHNPIYDAAIQIQAIQEVYAAKFAG